MLVTDSRRSGPKNIGIWPLKCGISNQGVKEVCVCLICFNTYGHQNLEEDVSGLGPTRW